jgi:hypothetical protein
VLALGVTCIVVLPVLALGFFVVSMSRGKLARFKFSAKVLKLLDISIEVDAQDRPGELPGSQPDSRA